MTPAARQLVAWADAVNSGDPATVARYFVENCVELPEHAEKEMMFWRTDGLDLRVTEQDTKTTFAALVEDRATGFFRRVPIGSEPDEPRRVTSPRVDTGRRHRARGPSAIGSHGSTAISGGDDGRNR
jgi:hypothetical protein